MDLNSLLNDFKQELVRASVDAKHPFRYVVLSTAHNGPHVRYVVLRKVDKFNKLFIYTDYRSEKVQEIQSAPDVELLFYHPRKKFQVRLQGTAMMHYGNYVTEKHWVNVQGNAKRSYTSILAPGTPIDHPENAYEWDDEKGPAYFTVLEIDSTEIEVLVLGGSKHIRTVYKIKDNWKGQWIVP